MTDTLVFLLGLSLAESKSVFALSFDNQGDSLTFGVVVLICLLVEGKIICGLQLQSTKSATCALKFGAGLVFLVCYGPWHFLSFFWNCTTDYFMS